MALIQCNSLAATVDAVGDAFFWRRVVSAADRKKAALAIASRQGLPGSYRGMFAPIGDELSGGLRLFTGESVATRAGSLHILGEEALRALLLLDVRSKDVDGAIARAGEEMMRFVRETKPSGRLSAASDRLLVAGTYCCMKCSVALWRQLAVRSDAASERFIAMGLKALRSRRDGAGGWRGWPFYYTLLALTEIDLPPARAELKYAAPRCETLLSRRAPLPNVYSLRRRETMSRALSTL